MDGSEPRKMRKVSPSKVSRYTVYGQIGRLKICIKFLNRSVT